MVGYDLAQYCCEDADYFIQGKPQLNGRIKDGNTYTEDFLADFSFDTEYFEETSSDDLKDGGMVIFKLDNEDGESIYLHLFNAHNGYYGHGFKAKIKGVQWQDDVL